MSVKGKGIVFAKAYFIFDGTQGDNFMIPKGQNCISSH